MKIDDIKEILSQNNFLNTGKPVKTDLEKLIETQRAHIDEIKIDSLPQLPMQISLDPHLPNISFPQVRRASLINYDVKPKTISDEVTSP